MCFSLIPNVKVFGMDAIAANDVAGRSVFSDFPCKQLFD